MIFNLCGIYLVISKQKRVEPEKPVQGPVIVFSGSGRSGAWCLHICSKAILHLITAEEAAAAMVQLVDVWPVITVEVIVRLNTTWD